MLGLIAWTFSLSILSVYGHMFGRGQRCLEFGLKTKTLYDRAMPFRHRSVDVELRHLRYFIAVAEEGSFINAAERRLHTAQPSLSRQIRDLELEVGVKLLERKARGIALTAAGPSFPR